MISFQRELLCEVVEEVQPLLERLEADAQYQVRRAQIAASRASSSASSPCRSAARRRSRRPRFANRSSGASAAMARHAARTAPRRRTLCRDSGAV